MRNPERNNQISGRAGSYGANIDKLFKHGLMVMLALCCACLGACSSAKDSPEDKLSSISLEDAPQDIFNVLSDYPALEACFTKSGLSRTVFEEKLFRGLLANTTNANVMADMLDGIEPLFEERTVTEGLFSEDIEAQMNSRGPVPDLFLALSLVPRSIRGLPEDERAAFYAYLDLPDESGYQSTSTYMRNIFKDVFTYLATCDADTVNGVMDITSAELLAKQCSKAQSLDFKDFDTELLELATLAPDGLADVLHAMRDISARPDFKDGMSDLVQGVAAFLQLADLYPETKTMLSGLDASFTKDTLGEVFERAWTRGPIPGAAVEAMGIEKYGKDGKYWGTLRELFMQPEVMNAFFEEIYRMHQQGNRFDRVDDALRQYVVCDPFLQPRDGPGEYGGGKFYTPSSAVSYKDYTALNGWMDNCSRMGIPLSLDAPFMFENAPNGDAMKKLMRTLIPTCTQIPIPATVWADVYETGAGYAYGHGQPVTTLKGYGMMKNGVFVAPNTPDCFGGSAWCLSQIGDACLNGPYDNIWDNHRWMMFERNYYMVMDMVQFAKRMPLLKAPFEAYFKKNKIDMFPLVIQRFKGMNAVLYTDMNTLAANMLKEIGLSGLPSSLTDLMGYALGQLMGTQGLNTKRVYIFPQDQRDVWTVAVAFSFWDKDAFHLDRFLNQDDPATYQFYYDPRNYTYAKNPDKANPIMPFVAAFTISAYKQYRAVVDQWPASLDYMETRQAAARAAFGGLEHPIQYCCNMLNALQERPLTQNAYIEQPKFLKLLRPLMDNESTGSWDAIWKLTLIMGKPELKEARLRLFNGLAAILATTGEGTSDGAYALAGGMLNTPQKAKADARYWDALEFQINAGAALLSDTYDVRDNLIGLICSASDELTAAQKAALSQGMTTVMGNLAEEQVFSRTLTDLSDIVKHLNSTHNWRDQALLMQDMLADEGVVDYVITGMKKAAGNTWDEMLRDLDSFLHSDLIMSVKEGSFWDAIKILVKFIVDAIE